MNKKPKNDEKSVPTLFPTLFRPFFLFLPPEMLCFTLGKQVGFVPVASIACAIAS